MKQNKYNDLEVSDLPKENANVDELARHGYYTVKAIRRLTLSEAKSSVPFPPTGSFINEQYVTIPNLLYNFINCFIDSKAASMICHRQNESLFPKRFSSLFANTRTCNLRPQCLLH
jgi:hypothetical protein